MGVDYLNYDIASNVLFEDNHVIVVIKPPGVLSQADGKDIPDMLSLIKAYIKVKYDKPGDVFLGLVHRLDLNVGGVMVFARTSKGASRLSEAIKTHEFKKEYYAILNGFLPLGQTDTLTDFISKDEDRRMGVVSDEDDGKPAKLHYTVIGHQSLSNQTLTLVQISLISGRFHQIRLQFSSRNLPLFGDQKYGGATTKHQNELGLYAFRLSFPHPITKTLMTFEKRPESPLFTQFF